MIGTTLQQRRYVKLAMLILTATAATEGPFTPEKVNAWLSARCGETGSAIWAYEGALYDPIDGRKICAVEGIELIRRLPIENTDKSSVLLKINGLQEQGSTILSRKLFCYPSPESPRKLLESVKLRHNSPRRTIPMHQAVAFYDCATTYIGRHNGTELVVHTEFPDGKCFWSTSSSCDSAQQQQLTTTNINSNHDVLDFTVYTKKRSTDLPVLSNATKVHDTTTSTISPKRSRLIQFGPAPKQEQEGRFGARETYSYTFTKNNNIQHPPKWQFWKSQSKTPSSPVSCQLKYTRYGEGPPWYSTGGGKFCQLELHGRMVHDISHVPPLAASVAARQHGFLTVASPITNAPQAIKWFRQDSKSNSFLQEQQVEGSMRVLQKRGEQIWDALRKASRLTQGSSKDT